MKDYYYILGVDNTASKQQIKQAYRKLSLKFHPDKNDGDKYFEERFKEIQIAYETLSNDRERVSYNRKWNENQNNKNWYDKEKEINRREEELRRKEEELRRKYQTPEEKLEEEKIKEEAQKKAREKKLRIRLKRLQEELKDKNNSLDKIFISENNLKKDINHLNKEISDIETILNIKAQKREQNYNKNTYSKPKNEGEIKYKIVKGDYDLFGYKDKDNNLVIEYKFEDAFPFHEGCAAVIYKDKRGYIDTFGNFIIPPIYDREGGTYFNNGVAKVYLNGKELIIDTQGRVLFG